MKPLLNLLALASLSGCATQTPSRQGEARALFNKPPHVAIPAGETEVALIAGQGGRRYVSFKVHGRDALFLVDTGAVTTIVSHTVAREAGLTTIPVPHGTLYGGGGASAASAGRITDMSVAGVAIFRLPVFFTDLTDWNTRESAAQHQRIDGILGSDLLDYLGATLDYKTNTLKLRRPPAQPVDEDANPLIEWLEYPEKRDPTRVLVLAEVVRVEREEFSLTRSNSLASSGDDKPWTDLMKVRTGMVTLEVIESPGATLPRTVSAPFRAQHYIEKPDDPWRGSMIKPGQRLLGFFRQGAGGEWESESPFFMNVVTRLLDPQLGILLPMAFKSQLADPEAVKRQKQEDAAADTRAAAKTRK